MSKKHAAQNEGHRQIIRSTKAKRSAKKAKAHGSIDHPVADRVRWSDLKKRGRE